jgi:phage virion morphogenesis protein
MRRLFAESTIMDSIGEDVARWGQDRITGRGNTGPDGFMWPALNPKYAAKKRKNFPPQGTLMAQGSMWASIVHKPAPDDASVEIGSVMPYAAIHQFGGKTGKGHRTTIPARPYLGLSERQKELLKEKVTLWLKRLVEGK